MKWKRRMLMSHLSFWAQMCQPARCDITWIDWNNCDQMPFCWHQWLTYQSVIHLERVTTFTVNSPLFQHTYKMEMLNSTSAAVHQTTSKITSNSQSNCSCERLTRVLHRPWCHAWRRNTCEETSGPDGRRRLWQGRGSVHRDDWWNDSRCHSEQHQYKMYLIPVSPPPSSSPLLILIDLFEIGGIWLLIKATVFPRQILPNSTRQFVKFREILQHYYPIPNILYSVASRHWMA